MEMSTPFHRKAQFARTQAFATTAPYGTICTAALTVRPGWLYLFVTFFGNKMFEGGF